LRSFSKPAGFNALERSGISELVDFCILILLRE